MTSSDIVAKIRAEKNSNIDTLILEASNVEISNNIGLIIPVGTTDERGTTSRKGTIRYNSTDTAFEGYDGINWGTLGGVKDVSQTTLIRAETSPGANNKQLDFITNNIQRMQIDSNGDLKFGDISNQDIKFSLDYQTGGTQTIIPKTDMTYDLGSSNNSWDKLYLQKAITPASDSGIYLNGQRIMYMDTNGNLKIGTSSGTVNIPGNFDINGGLNICGELIVNGDVSLNDNVDISNNLNVKGLIHFFNNIDSNSSTNGALVVDGGVGISKNLNVSGTFTSNIESVLYSNSSLTPQNVFQPFVPPGAVMSFATKGAPQGWLECSGQILLRSDYQNLFDVIGTTWDNGVGNNEFRLPNLNGGYFIRGGVVNGNLILDTTAKPSGFSATTADAGSHSHGIDLADLGGTGGTRFKSSSAHIYSHVPTYYASTAGAGVHYHTVNITGWDTETAPMHVILLYCIKY